MFRKVFVRGGVSCVVVQRKPSAMAWTLNVVFSRVMFIISRGLATQQARKSLNRNTEKRYGKLCQLHYHLWPLRIHPISKYILAEHTIRNKFYTFSWHVFSVQTLCQIILRCNTFKFADNYRNYSIRTSRCSAANSAQSKWYQFWSFINVGVHNMVLRLCASVTLLRSWPNRLKYRVRYCTTGPSLYIDVLSVNHDAHNICWHIAILARSNLNILIISRTLVCIISNCHSDHNYYNFKCWLIM